MDARRAEEHARRSSANENASSTIAHDSAPSVLVHTSHAAVGDADRASTALAGHESGELAQGRERRAQQRYQQTQHSAVGLVVRLHLTEQGEHARAT